MVQRRRTSQALPDQPDQGGIIDSGGFAPRRFCARTSLRHWRNEHPSPSLSLIRAHIGHPLAPTASLSRTFECHLAAGQLLQAAVSRASDQLPSPSLAPTTLRSLVGQVNPRHDRSCGQWRLPDVSHRRRFGPTWSPSREEIPITGTSLLLPSVSGNHWEAQSWQL